MEGYPGLNINPGMILSLSMQQKSLHPAGISCSRVVLQTSSSKGPDPGSVLRKDDPDVMYRPAGKFAHRFDRLPLTQQFFARCAASGGGGNLSKRCANFPAGRYTLRCR